METNIDYSETHKTVEQKDKSCDKKTQQFYGVHLT